MLDRSGRQCLSAQGFFSKVNRREGLISIATEKLEVETEDVPISPRQESLNDTLSP